MMDGPLLPVQVPKSEWGEFEKTTISIALKDGFLNVFKSFKGKTSYIGFTVQENIVWIASFAPSRGEDLQILKMSSAVKVNDRYVVSIKTTGKYGIEQGKIYFKCCEITPQRFYLSW